AGIPFRSPLVGRGVTFADYDGDGRIDVLVCNLEGRALLLHNTTGSNHHWLRVRLRGAGANTQGLGSRVTIETGGRRQVREVRTCGSVMSSLEPVAHFGLGDTPQVDRLEVRWPDGQTTTRDRVPADQILEIESPSVAHAPGTAVK